MKTETGLFPVPIVRTFVAVKVKASADLVLAALAPFVHGMPRDIMTAARGSPLPADGRDLGRRAILYRIERDGWTTILREGEPTDAYDPNLAKRLSRLLATRALAIYLDASFAGAGRAGDLVYDLYQNGEVVEGAFAPDGGEVETHGSADATAIAASPLAHARALLAREATTNDRIAFADFERSGALRGRWDLTFDRCVLLPELVPIDDDEPAPAKKAIASAPDASAAIDSAKRLERLFGTIVDDKLSQS